MLGKKRYLLFAVVSIIVASAGLYLGKTREKDYLSGIYGRTDFTLLDDSDDFFRLSALPANERLLLIFTPDGIHPATVPAFMAFSRHLEDFRQRHIRVALITRTNKEIVANFKRASGFKGKVLYDLSGTVGRIVGVWPSLQPVTHWGYVLLDAQFNQHFVQVANAPVSYEELIAQIPQAPR
jgi:peroxiredoxin